MEKDKIGKVVAIGIAVVCVGMILNYFGVKLEVEKNADGTNSYEVEIVDDKLGLELDIKTNSDGKISYEVEKAE